jgi:guanosine-3',5'-bis(diphosphate) 3'-pyrophosphohydrolase
MSKGGARRRSRLSSHMPRRAANPHDLWQRAASLCARRHQHQFRKDGVTPYAAHPFRVALTLRHVFGCDDPLALAAALLHDLIEDTTVDYDDLEEGFGREIADCVAALTKNAALPEPQREHDYDRRLAEAGWRAHAIKLADCFDNLSDALAGRTDAVPKVLGKCRRALDIVEGSTQPCVQRGQSELRSLMKRARAGRGK